MDERYRLPCRPVADPRAVVAGPDWRITVLTDGLVRLEHDPSGSFEDRPSAFALHRRLPVPDFEVVHTDSHVEVVTERLHLVYDRRPFSTSGLSIAVRGGVSSWHSVWRYGVDDEPGGLGGTARTLDEADGAVPLEPGVASRNGFAVLDDSRTLVLEEDGWVAPRDGSAQDLYVFAYGRDHAQAVRALYAVSGPQPLLPRWALGNWWSRYHRYTAEEYLALLDRFAAERLPFSVAVVDMDWHLTQVEPRFGSGWTGYTWNRELFPDPAGFLEAVHERGLRVTLNDHPADGVQPHEAAYPAMAAALGIDPATERPIPFDVTDPDLLRAWFDVLHRPLEEEGVDFWWIDWQQGPHSRVAGVDPLWMLNHFHFLDSARDGRRPLTFSRYAGPGSHRYPVGFSGDAVVSWASLDFQAEFTATAANIGFGWWSHDVGGHLFGARDDDLAARWVQLGVLSPITRLHSMNNPFMSKEPWAFGPAARASMEEALRLRHRLVPYLHTMNHRAAHEGVPLVTPMYHEHPWREEAYRARTQYAFGSQLLVAPITTPTDPQLLLGSVTAWLPEGTWVDVLADLVYDGGRELVLHRGLDAVPVLARAGALVPLDAEPGNDPVNPSALEVLLVVGADGAFDLVEDDGAGRGDEPERWLTTPLRFDAAAGVVTVGPARGNPACAPARRSWTLTLPACVLTGAEALVDGEPAPARVQVQGRRTRVTVDAVPVTSALQLRLGASPRLAPNDVADRVLALLHRAQIPYATKTRAHEAATADAPLALRLSRLQALDLGRPLETALFELLLARAQEPAAQG
ncbi:TIM-barrel domain-containing protein [Quadrisphaera sp. DSM 44207]|uniref:glycoside hydrolase family 31 protein n=1 Tax=Quadrisphaera sp. DSM 44207 TaxID=1881057 RepID=UPI000888862E|nr:TIM-barrel domain-containing protein [Quadrisphaera sp. DSM 44207]SDQ36109.1 Alpha-glucosidase, glycosyl hydrolase family GH31 [Quadrisphaera sp. DSM 44207]